jgi:hypothetical protein
MSIKIEIIELLLCAENLVRLFQAGELIVNLY